MKRWRETRRKLRYAARNVPSARPRQVALALEELRRRTDGIAARSESLSARAGLLVASAALVATLQNEETGRRLVLGAVVLALVAAGFGIAAVFPGTIRYPTIEDTRAELWRHEDIEDAQWWLVDRLSEQYADAKNHLDRRGKLLRGGFVSLGASILLTAIAVATRPGG